MTSKEGAVLEYARVGNQDRRLVMKNIIRSHKCYSVILQESKSAKVTFPYKAFPPLHGWLALDAINAAG